MAKLLFGWVVSGVIGNFAFGQLQGLDPSPLRDVVLILIWPLAIISGTILGGIWLWRSSSGARTTDPDRISRPEWDSANQVQHYEGIRKMAHDAKAELRNVAAGEPTVRDQTNLRNLVDSLDLQVGNYSQLWASSSLYKERLRNKWLDAPRKRYDGPAWGRQLWDRIDYAQWWIQTHDPTDWEYDMTQHES
jgi:hypothetical protein